MPGPALRLGWDDVPVTSGGRGQRPGEQGHCERGADARGYRRDATDNAQVTVFAVAGWLAAVTSAGLPRPGAFHDRLGAGFVPFTHQSLDHRFELRDAVGE